MRSIFLSLIILNAAVLAFYWFQSDTVTAVTENRVAGVVRSGDAPLLVLLDELEAAELSRMFAAKERVQFQSEGVVTEGKLTAVPQIAEIESPLPDALMCTYVGPFKALLPAEYFVEHLSALEVEAEVQRVEVPGEPSFWVYQAPESSRKAALRKLHELQAKGVDSYVIPKGDLENGISYGLYNREDRAKGRLELILKKGYAADIRRVDRTFEEVWVSLGVSEAEKVGEELWFELMNREDGLEKRQNFCPDVASD